MFNDVTGKYIYFDYDKIEEIDNRPLTKKDFDAIKKFKEHIRKLYEEGEDE